MNAIAAVNIDRDNDGINIDDIVYYNYQEGHSLPSSTIRNLLYQIAPFNLVPTAAEVAEGLTSIEYPDVDDISLLIPKAPNGYTFELANSDNVQVIGLDGVISPPDQLTIVGVTIKVTRIYDSSIANTGVIPITVPARSLTAAEVAANISSISVPVPVTNAGYMPLPTVPSGYTIAVSESDNELVVNNNGVIIPPETATPVNLIFTVTRLSDDQSANTAGITVIVPARSRINIGGTVTASIANQNDWEGMLQAFDGDTSRKWLANFSSGMWIQYQLVTPHIVTNYSISSADDSQGRDPKAWSLQGSNDGTNWFTLDVQTNQIFADRKMTKNYIFNNNTSYLYYRLNVTATFSDALIQLSEIAYFGTSAAAPTVPTGFIDFSNNSDTGVGFGSPAAEKKRWQTFTANSFPNLTSVDVKIRKISDGTIGDGTTQSDVTVELFASNGITPIGNALALGKISSNEVAAGESFSTIRIPIAYNALIQETKYAIVLGQEENSDDHYQWSVDDGDRTGLYFGRFDGETWEDESFNAWLMVNVSY